MTEPEEEDLGGFLDSLSDEQHHDLALRTANQLAAAGVEPYAWRKRLYGDPLCRVFIVGQRLAVLR